MMYALEFTEESGAEGGSNLEPLSSEVLLQTLEEWSEVLKHDVELTHMLAAFEKASHEQHAELTEKSLKGSEVDAPDGPGSRGPA